MKLLKVLSNLLLVLVIALAGLGLYVLWYHNSPPIPQIEGFFKNVSYDLSSGDPSMFKKEGLYTWRITNNNDFAWPDPLIVYGENHLFYGWDLIEPGETMEFSNAFLANINTQEIEAVPLEVGQSVTIDLKIDFSGEDSLASRIFNLLGLKKVETYRLGTWNR